MKTAPRSLIKCDVPDCSRGRFAKNWCQRHYDRLRNNGDLSPKWAGERLNFNCTAPGCEKPARANTLCSAHIQRVRVSGTLGLVKLPVPLHCIADSCMRKTLAKGLCVKHYSSIRNRGTLDAPIRKTLGERRTRMKQHYRDNKAYYKAKKIRRENRLRLATPQWLSAEQMAEMNQFYRECPEGYEVDHIIPLNSPKVSGLHVRWNLQYLTREENRKKSNKV